MMECGLTVTTAVMVGIQANRVVKTKLSGRDMYCSWYVSESDQA